jgi:hypothetical protein
MCGSEVGISHHQDENIRKHNILAISVLQCGCAIELPWILLNWYMRCNQII